MIVADASLLGRLLIPGTDQSMAEAIQRRTPDWRAPGLWTYELRNVLLKYIRAGVLSEDAANSTMSHALQIMGNVSSDAPSPHVLATAVSLGISAYDAAYVALAEQLRVPLITFDQKL